MGYKKIKIGDRFHYWTVINGPKQKHGKPHWLCKCKCGTVRLVDQYALIGGYSKSCGCRQKKTTNRGKLIKLNNGEKFGKLIVLKRYGIDSSGVATWLCKCDCGNTVIVKGPNLVSGQTKSCGCLRGGHNRLPYREAAFNALYNKLKWRALKRGYCWELTKEQVKILTSSECFYCGQPPEMLYGDKRTNTGMYVYNGIDRVDNTKGYIPGNVVSCCKKCNVAKHTMSIDEFKNWLIKVYNHFILNT